jgi:flagellar hook-associated protein 3 FlgL
MRVTHQTIATQVIDELQRAYQRVAKTQEMVTTGRRINHLSDDPIGAARVLGFLSAERSLDQYEKNLNTAVPLLEQGDSVLDQVVDRLARAKELAVAMASDSHSAEQRAQTAIEIRELFNQVLGIANTKVEDRFIFAGFLNTAPPFAVAGGTVVYGGDSGEIFVQTGEARSIALNVPGDQVFQGAGVAAGVDVFDVFLDLETALQGNDAGGADGIRTQIGRLDQAIDQVLSFRAEFGARANSAQAAREAIQVMKGRYREWRSQFEDADALAVYSDFARYQYIFQAALQSASQMLQPSLLDFLR